MGLTRRLERLEGQTLGAHATAVAALIHATNVTPVAVDHEANEIDVVPVVRTAARLLRVDRRSSAGRWRRPWRNAGGSGERPGPPPRPAQGGGRSHG